MKNKTILFLSSINHLSMMAEAWASQLPHPSWEITSAARLKARCNALPCEAMKEVNVAIDCARTQESAVHVVKKADIVVAIYDFQYDCVPLSAAESKVLYWHVPNPLQFTRWTERWAAYQEVCDELAVKTKQLEKELL